MVFKRVKYEAFQYTEKGVTQKMVQNAEQTRRDDASKPKQGAENHGGMERDEGTSWASLAEHLGLKWCRERIACKYAGAGAPARTCTHK